MLNREKKEGREVAIIVMLADGGIRDGASFNDSLQDSTLSASHIVVPYLCFSGLFLLFCFFKYFFILASVLCMLVHM